MRTRFTPSSPLASGPCATRTRGLVPGGLARAGLLVLALALAPAGARAGDRSFALSRPDTAFLDDLEWRAVRYFVEQTDERTGLTLDRASVDGLARAERAPSSVAATGFALTAWCIADARGWLPAGEVQRRVRDTLRFVAGHHAQERGWLYHFVDAASGRRVWQEWRREPRVSVGGRSFIQCGPLFTHQYAHGWFDFRGQRDGFADYWQNSVDATLAQREWAAAQRDRFPLWSAELWGLTASDSARGYVAWGTPGPDQDQSDGTLVPCAPGGSLPFAPRECLAALRRMREVGGARVWGRYGFVDAFNPHTGWASPDVIGINVGITLVMAENLRTGLVWRSFMRAPEVQRGLRLAGFAPT